MKLTAEQERAVHSGQPVQVSVGGAACILLRKDIYDRGEAVDFSPWTLEEMDLLAAETAQRERGTFRNTRGGSPARGGQAYERVANFSPSFGKFRLAWVRLLALDQVWDTTSRVTRTSCLECITPGSPAATIELAASEILPIGPVLAPRNCPERSTYGRKG